MKKITLLLLLMQFTLVAQKAKNEGWYIDQLHYPEIKLATNITTFTLQFNPYQDTFKLYMYKDKYDTNFQNAKFPTRDQDLFVLPNLTKSENGELHIEITDLGMQHNMNVEEKIIFVGSNSTKSYIGTVTISNAIKVTATNKITGALLYENIYKKNQVYQTINNVANQPILSKDAALDATKTAYKNEQQYEAHNLNFMSAALGEIATSLKSKFSLYQESQRINLFRIKNAEKYNCEAINKQVDKMFAFNKENFSPTYEATLKQLATESLAVFESEVAKLTDVKDKNQSKIYWSLLSNLSGTHYALGNYDKALEYAKKRMEIDYNQEWKLNLQITEDRIKSIANYNAQN